MGNDDACAFPRPFPGTNRPIVASGLVALAIAMGIGRFAFTPLMPLMVRDGTLDVASGAEWAAANYLGYFVGALTASWFSGNPRRGLLLSLLGVAVTTLAMAAVGASSPGFLGLGLRAAAGVFSAWALICASGWCLAELARRGRRRAGGLDLYRRRPRHRLRGRADMARRGPAGGEAVARTGGDRRPRRPAGPGPVPRPGTQPAKIAEREAAAVAPLRGGGQTALVICYGTFGFGYIVPATFLPPWPAPWHRTRWCSG